MSTPQAPFRPGRRAAPRGPRPFLLAALAGPDAGSVVAVEVLVEPDQVAPVRVLLELRSTAVDRPPAARVAQEDVREAAGDLLLRSPGTGSSGSGAGRTLDLEVVAVGRHRRSHA